MDNKVKRHFEEEAKEFDRIIWKLIPYYPQMVQSLIAAIPFKSSEPIKVIDLGCGTGTISKAIKEIYPNASLTCIDFANNMIRMAEAKLAAYSDVCFQVADFCNYKFDRIYDVVVSSLALHHLETDADKKEFYKKIYENLSIRGIFYNADIVLGTSDHLQIIYMKQWKEFMSREVSRDEIENKWITKYYEEDRPAALINQLEWLHNIGFSNIDVLWKYYNFAVFGGQKLKSG